MDVKSNLNLIAIHEGYVMKKKIKILSEEQVYKRAIFQIIEGKYQHEIQSNEWSEPITRLNLLRSDAVAVLVHNIDTDELIFTDQFRYPTYDKTGGWLLELPAGMIDEGEDPSDSAKREILEEIGYVIHDLEHLQTFYLSPGTSSERIFLYYATVRNVDKKGKGGGLVSEGEFIRIVNIKLREAIKSLNNGTITDAKTIIGLQWLEKNKL